MSITRVENRVQAEINNPGRSIRQKDIDRVLSRYPKSYKRIRAAMMRLQAEKLHDEIPEGSEGRHVVSVYDFDVCGLEVSHSPITAKIDGQRSSSYRTDLSEQERHKKDIENMERSERRAKKGIRLSIKELTKKTAKAYFWTLTLDAGYETYDIDVMQEIWERFRQNLNTHIDDFRFVKIIEPQPEREPACLSFHFVTDTFIPKELIDRVWDTSYKGAGYTFVRGPRRGMPPGQAAGYMAKYFSKDLSFWRGNKGRQRYTCSEGLHIEPETFIFKNWAEAQVFLYNLTESFEQVYRYVKGYCGMMIATN